MMGSLPVSALEVIGVQLRVTFVGKMLVAVGVFMRVGGPSVSTARTFEVCPKPMVFCAVTRKLTYMFAGKLTV